MLYRTHLAFGIIIGIITWSWIGFRQAYSNIWGLWFGGFIFFGLLSIGALLPDIDHPKSKLGNKIPKTSHFFHFVFGHRGFFHSLFFVVILSGILLVLFGNMISFPFMIGMLSHLFSDCLSTEGINLIYPFHQLSVKGFIETGSIAEFIVFFLAVIFILTTIFGRFIF